MAITAVTAIEFVSAAPEVTDITAKQRYPWNGLVDIGCKVSGIEGTINGYTFVVVAVDKDSGKEYAATHCTVEKVGSSWGQSPRQFARQIAHIPRSKVVRNADALAGVRFCLTHGFVRV